MKPLILHLHDENQLVRKAVAKVLGELGDAQAVEPLMTALKDLMPEVRYESAVALGKLGDKRAGRALAAACEDENESVPRVAAFAVKRIGWKPPVATDTSKPIEVLRQLCDAYAENDKARIVELEPLATKIGEDLDRRGGLDEMRRIFEQLGGRPGSRTLEMHWNGIGDWRS